MNLRQAKVSASPALRKSRRLLPGLQFRVTTAHERGRFAGCARFLGPFGR